MYLQPQDGAGAVLAMQRALAHARSQPEQVAYLNAHATSTPLGKSSLPEDDFSLT